MEDKSEIKVYEYHEHIRLRPGMYIGSVGNRGILKLIKGLTADISGRANSAVSITYTLVDNYNITLSINSSHADVIHTSFLATDYFNQNMYPLAAKALCSSFSITYKGQCQQFDKGVKVGVKTCPHSEIIDVKLILDESIFPSLKLDYYLLCQKLYYVAVLNPLASIKVEDRRSSEDALTFSFPDGIKSHFMRLCTTALSEAKYDLTIERTITDNQYTICIGWGDFRYDDGKHETYCNNKYLKWGGSLIDGIRQGLLSVYKRHNSNDVKANPRLPALTIAAVLKTPNPIWAGSTKWALGMPDVKSEVKKVVIEAFENYIRENPDKAAKLLDNMCRY